MIRQTGGLELGATSTRSRPSSSAFAIASSGVITPSCEPSLPITRISASRIRSLTRGVSFRDALLNSAIRHSSGEHALSSRDTAARIPANRWTRFAIAPMASVTAPPLPLLAIDLSFGSIEPAKRWNHNLTGIAPLGLFRSQPLANSPVAGTEIVIATGRSSSGGAPRRNIPARDRRR